MQFATYVFKQKAREALKGNWQTALVVSFFAGIFTLAASLYHLSGDLQGYLMLGTEEKILEAIKAVPARDWAIFGALQLVAFVLSPVLDLGLRHYFVRRLKGEELGYLGLLSRGRYLGKALLLEILMMVKIFLWSLLLIVPGIVAGFRYSMAPYYLAEDPNLSAWEAIEKSKHAMRETKLLYFVLDLSFIGWYALSIAAQYTLLPVSPVLATVAGQGLNLVLTTYMNGAFAAFFLAVSQNAEAGAAGSGDGSLPDQPEMDDEDQLDREPEDESPEDLR